MMKIISKISILFAVLLSTQTHAQYYQSNSGAGVDRSIGAETRYNDKPTKAEPVDYVKIMVDNMTEKLNLDGFQSAIVKKLIEDYTKTVEAISLENIPNDAKTEKSNIAKNTMESKFGEIFTDKQKVLFEELKNKNLTKKSKKKNKKDSEE